MVSSDSDGDSRPEGACLGLALEDSDRAFMSHYLNKIECYEATRPKTVTVPSLHLSAIIGSDLANLAHLPDPPGRLLLFQTSLQPAQSTRILMRSKKCYDPHQSTCPGVPPDDNVSPSFLQDPKPRITGWSSLSIAAFIRLRSLCA
jgi:hypothetical protein